MPEQGDILLIPIPYTDLSSTKRRPVIVILNNAYNQILQFFYPLRCFHPLGIFL